MVFLGAMICPELEAKIKYRTNFGNCPSRTVGNLTLDLIKAYEKEESLFEVKRRLSEEGVLEKYFIQSYEVNKNPVTDTLTFKYQCPTPIMKAFIMKENGRDNYSAILADSGTLLDPTYEELLRQESKLSNDLPLLSISVDQIGKESQSKLNEFINHLDQRSRKKISEAILDGDGRLIVVLSHMSIPSTVYLGENEWGEKAEKLNKMIEHFEKSDRFPKSINLTSQKKVVVKFLDNP